jgi:L-lactate permease
MIVLNKNSKDKQMKQTLKNTTGKTHRVSNLIAVVVLCVVSLITFSSDDYIMSRPVARVTGELVTVSKPHLSTDSK